jgi:hypothetical protein
VEVLWAVVGLIDARRWRRASRSRFSTALTRILSSYFFFFAGKRSPSLSCGADFSSPSATRHQTAISAPCSRASSRLAPARHYSLLRFALPLISLHFLLYGGQGLVPPVPAARDGFAGRLVSFTWPLAARCHLLCGFASCFLFGDLGADSVSAWGRLGHEDCVCCRRLRSVRLSKQPVLNCSVVARGSVLPAALLSSVAP